MLNTTHSTSAHEAGLKTQTCRKIFRIPGISRWLTVLWERSHVGSSRKNNPSTKGEARIALKLAPFSKWKTSGKLSTENSWKLVRKLGGLRNAFNKFNLHNGMRRRATPEGIGNHQHECLIMFWAVFCICWFGKQFNTCNCPTLKLIQAEGKHLTVWLPLSCLVLILMAYKL